VSKSVALYQKYVHIKACLATGYTPRAWRQVKMMYIPATGKPNYTQAKAYCPISLLSFMWKMTQKFETRNVRDETMGNVPYIYNKLPTNHGSPINRNVPCDYTYTGSSGKDGVTLELS
jgi:hypothetical protein